MLAAVASVLILGLSSAGRNTFALLNDKADLAIDSVVVRVRHQLDPARDQITYLTGLIESGKLDPDDRQSMLDTLQGALAATPQVTGVGFSPLNQVVLRAARVNGEVLRVGIGPVRLAGDDPGHGGGQGPPGSLLGRAGLVGGGQDHPADASDAGPPRRQVHRADDRGGGARRPVALPVGTLRGRGAERLRALRPRPCAGASGLALQGIQFFRTGRAAAAASRSGGRSGAGQPVAQQQAGRPVHDHGPQPNQRGSRRDRR